MQFKHTLLAAVISSGFIMQASAHEITFALGGLGTTFNVQQEYKDTDPATAGDLNGSGTANGLGGEAALAYVWNVNSGFDIGFEFFYDFTGNLQVKGPTNAITTLNNVWGVRALPAFRITNNTKIYIDLGYAMIDQTLDVADVVGIGAAGFTTTSAKSSNTGGFQYGAGIETMIYNTVGIRLAYTAQQAAKLSLSDDDGDATFSSTPTVYQFFFGGTYHFQF
ncbi:MAG: outer membrane protein [Gammaproteobacteria bacterium]